jgi:DNA-binding response OmpR family regulator
MKVLVIDDDIDMRTILRELLDDNGYDVYEAENGEEGLRTFDQQLPDLVITDIVMPDREGISTIMELRKKPKKAKIIAISGGGEYTTTGYLDVAKKLGADRTFVKPPDLEQLLQAVKELLPE